ncbi:hypothetical protein PCE1_003965 [Barthelona sp. PCE]
MFFELGYITFETVSLVIFSLFLSIIGFWVSKRLIPSFAEKLERAGLSGIDLNKLKPKEDDNDPKRIPEGVGIVSGTLFVVFVIILTSFMRISEAETISFYAGLICILLNLLSGFIDDVIALRWRYKIILSVLSSVPLITCWKGATDVIVPTPLRRWLPDSIELGPLYTVYLLALTTFCSNSINIYAGINGIEVGQSLILSGGCLLHSIIRLFSPQHDKALLSVCVLLPFFFVCLALFQFNKYPSKVFIGDSFTYFAGTALAVAALFGHFTKTLLLFFTPQIINFMYSLPQLIGIIPCPRHRLPRYDPKTDKLVGVPEHMTLINLWLRLFGPKHEKRLCRELMWFQVLCCIGALVLRNLLSFFGVLYT